MKKQPDFTKVFRNHFSDTPSKVMYQIRDGPNRFHDLVFLNSLIHDARFTRETAVLRGKRLSIPIERDCWELGTVEHSNSHELHIAKARLTISPVINIEWRFENETEFACDMELWIDYIWFQRRPALQDGPMPVVIYGFEWSCVLTVLEPDLKIRLQDLETPYLYSEKAKDLT